ncbi:MAG TPA: hypothetical protein VK756_03280 [Solirubrobacteraceae bacterium]|jgi:hypothetical protein|nr:hypothetical protein [Solirubrobacteraceae bacterium]
MDRPKTARNIAILLVIAAAVAFLPGGGRAASTVSTALGIVFAVGFAYAGVWFYRQNRVDLYGLGDRRRGLLYGAVGIAVVTVAAKPRLWETGFGEFVWFVLIGLVAYTLVALYRYSRSY